MTCRGWTRDQEKELATRSRSLAIFRWDPSQLKEAKIKELKRNPRLERKPRGNGRRNRGLAFARSGSWPAWRATAKPTRRSAASNTVTSAGWSGEVSV